MTWNRRSPPGGFRRASRNGVRADTFICKAHHNSLGRLRQMPRPADPGAITAPVVGLEFIRLAAALHRLGETIGVEVGSRADMLRRLLRIREAGDVR